MDKVRLVNRPSGFTLIEILIAILILGIVLSTILGGFTGIIASSREAEKRAELYQTGEDGAVTIELDGSAGTPLVTRYRQQHPRYWSPAD